jgi:flagellin-specific chaperone FliS
MWTSLYYVNDINDKQSIIKEFKNIIRCPEFKALESELMNEKGQKNLSGLITLYKFKWI